MVKHTRWCFNLTKWIPTCEDWLKLTSCVETCEVERCERFVYKEDCKSSLIGRALILKFLSQAIHQPSNELQLIRNAHGRPEIHPAYRREFLPTGCRIDFNVSHSGEYCVLAGFVATEEEELYSLGVDITKIVSKKNKQELDRFLSLMKRREFTKQEWKTVEEDARTDRQKCINFTRLWCLKESYIKAIGLGLAFKLDRIEFQVESPNQFQSSNSEMISSTKVLLDGRLAQDWTFLEGSIDSEHQVAIGYNHSFKNTQAVKDESPFIEVTINSILSELTPIREAQYENWRKFCDQNSRSL